MQSAQLPEIAIRSHLRGLRFILEGGRTEIPESSIDPVLSLQSTSGLEAFKEAGASAKTQMEKECILGSATVKQGCK